MNKLITITLVGLFLLSVSNAKDSNITTASVLQTTSLPTTTTGMRLTTTSHVESLTSTQTILVTATHVVTKGVEHEPNGHEQQAKEMLKTLDNHNYSSKLTFNLFSIIAVIIVHLF
jgi:hypothetical protein